MACTAFKRLVGYYRIRFMFVFAALNAHVDRFKLKYVTTTLLNN